LALDNTGSGADGNFTLFVLDHIGGDLDTALTPLGAVNGSFYDDTGTASAFDFNAPPQFFGTFDPGVPGGTSAWFEAYPAPEAAMAGSTLKFNANAASTASAFSGGHNLHVLTLATDTLALAGPPISTPTVTSTPRPSATRTLAATAIPTATSLNTPTRTATGAASATATKPAPTFTRTGTPTGPLPTATRTRSGTAILTATATVGASATATVGASATATNAGPSATPTSTPTGPTPTGSVSPSPTPTPPPCVGDCNGNGVVTVNELIIGVNILLSSQPVSACPAFDSNNTGTVTVEELIQGVNNLLRACPR
jgi:hypothetical protein